MTGFAPVARANEPFELSWRAPPECPQESQVRDRLRALLPTQTEPERLRATGSIERSKGAYRLRLAVQVGDVQGARSIESERCADLAGAAAVAIGLLIEASRPLDARDPTQASANAPSDTQRSSGSPGKASPSSSTGAVRPESAAASRGALASDRSWRIWLHAPAALVHVGPLPQPEWGTLIAAGLELSVWRFGLGAQASLPQTLTSERAASVKVEVQRSSLEAWACRPWRSPPFVLDPCVSLGVQHLSAQGEGARVSPQAGQATWISAGVTVAGRWHLFERLAVSGGIDARLGTARPRIRIEGLGELHQLAPAALTLRLGTEWFF